MQIRREEIGQYFREATWEALAKAASGLKRPHARGGKHWPASAAKGSNNLSVQLIRQASHQQRRSLHQAVHASSVAALIGVNSVPLPRRSRRPRMRIASSSSTRGRREPSGGGHLLKNAAARGAKLIVMDPRGQNQGIARYAHRTLQFKPGRDRAAQRHAAPSSKRAWSISSTCRRTPRALRRSKRR